MNSPQFITFKIEDRSYISIAKREIQKLLLKSSFDKFKAGEADIIVSELCSNLVKHASHGGSLICRVVNEPNEVPVLEIFCIDDGPGVHDIQKMSKDGNSSSNTLGQGLGAINRLCDSFQIYSSKNWGTVVYCKKYGANLSAKLLKVRSAIDVKVIQEAIPGESLCGDGYFVRHLPNETRIFFGDGLGHGVHAYSAVQEAIQAFKTCDEQSPINILKVIHEKVKKTRGLVASIAIINHLEEKWSIAGVGNISTRLYQGLEYKTYMPYNGVLGMNILNSMTDNIIDADKFQSIVMCSDGIRTKWELSKYNSILKYNPAIIAAAIFKDNARKTDDMTVLVGKLNLNR